MIELAAFAALAKSGLAFVQSRSSVFYPLGVRLIGFSSYAANKQRLHSGYEATDTVAGQCGERKKIEYFAMS
tara:strand:- start:326 stop:541 length:216 start_codon:yes stop_codon:yes gene_type:complete